MTPQSTQKYNATSLWPKNKGKSAAVFVTPFIFVKLGLGSLPLSSLNLKLKSCLAIFFPLQIHAAEREVEHCKMFQTIEIVRQLHSWRIQTFCLWVQSVPKPFSLPFGLLTKRLAVILFLAVQVMFCKHFEVIAVLPLKLCLRVIATVTPQPFTTTKM